MTPPFDPTRLLGDRVVREALRRADPLTRSPAYAQWLRLAVGANAAVARERERQRRMAAHLVGRTTLAERRERAEREARLGLRPDPGPGGVRRPAVFWHEDGDGPPLLLLNGWSASGLLWPAAWRAVLEEHHRVIRIDNRGTGWSRTARTPFTMARLADDAAEVLAATGGGPATVVGLSMGGMIAQELAVRHPELVARLVLAGTRPPAPAHVPADPEVTALTFASPAAGQPLEDYFRTMWTRFCAPGFDEREPALVDEIVAQVLQRPTPRVATLHQMWAIASWWGPERLRSITAPTVVVHGDVDPLMPVGNGMRLARLIEGSSYVELRGVGHLVPMEAPDALTEIVLDR